MAMMQQVVLKSFQETYGKQSLRKMSLLTGIQTTRIFRILNGCEMKVSEYEKFQNAIDVKLPAKDSINETVNISQKYLTNEMLNNVDKELKKLIQLRKISMGLITKQVSHG